MHVMSWGIQPGDKLYIAGSPSKKVIFCLKEEQLRSLIEKLTGEVETANELISHADKLED